MDVVLCANDASLGPGSTCRQLDFTIFFEQVILGILPNLCFIVVSAVTILQQWRSRSKAHPHGSEDAGQLRACAFKAAAVARLLLAIFFVSFNVAALALVPRHISPYWPQSAVFASASLALIASVLLLILQGLLHGGKEERTRPHTRISVFLLFEVLGAATMLRTTWFVHLQRSYPGYVAMQICLAVCAGLLLLIEERCVVFAHSDRSQKRNPEERLGFVASTSMMWLLPLLFSGVRHPLRSDRLYPVQKRLEAQQCSQQLLEHGSSRRTPRHHLHGLHLLWSFVSTFPAITLGPIPPRAVMVVLQLLQPLAIQQLVDHVGTSQTASSSSSQRAWALVAGISLLYLTITFINGAYWKHVYRATLAFRSAMVPCIFSKMLQQQRMQPLYGKGEDDEQSFCSSKEEDPALSNPAALMSVDIEKIVSALEVCHEVWAAIPTIGIGCYLLYARIGLSFLSCVAVIVLFLLTAMSLGSGMSAKQKRWFEQTQQRVTFSSRLLNRLKTVALTSYETFFGRRASDLRAKEVRSVCNYYRRLAAIAALTLSSTNVTVFVVFATAWAISLAEGNTPLSAGVVFSSLSVIQIIEAPINALGQYLSILLGASASFERIQTYQSLPLDRKAKYNGELQPIVHCIDQNLATGNRRTLHLVGKGASGKTTTLRQLLDHYTYNTYHTVGYVSQMTTLFDTFTIEDSITLGVAVDYARLESCLAFCCLDQDFSALRHGLNTRLNELSGGQQARVSLARAIYSHAPLLLLDDCLASLDAVTASKILARMYGEATLLQGRVILYASHAIVDYDDGNNLFACKRSTHSILFGSAAFDYMRSTESSADEPVKLDEPKNAFEEEEGLISDAAVAPTERNNIRPDAKEEEQHASRLGLAPYKFYLGACPKSWLFCGVILCTAGMGSTFAVQLVLQRWTEEEFEQPALYLTGMGLSAIGGGLAIAGSLFVFFAIMLPVTSQRIHDRAFNAVLRRKQSQQDSLKLNASQLVNRFTQDIFVIDSEFPLALFNTFANLLTLLGTFGTTIAAVPFLAAGMPLVVAVFYVLQLLYLRCSRQVRSMELESKTALFTLFDQTASARETILGLRRTDDFVRRCNAIVDQTQAPFYTRLAMLRFLRVSLYGLTWLITTVMAVLAVRLRNSISPYLLGVALTNVTSLAATLNSTLHSFATMETSAVAVERLRKLQGSASEMSSARATELCTDECGDDLELNTTPPVFQASSPALELRGVNLRYSLNGPRILQEVTFTVPAGSKLAICGRSGSGKSSLLMAILRSAGEQHDFSLDGSIKLFGKEANYASPDQWRKSFSYVAQEPLVWKDSIRNLLTLASSMDDDDALWEVLGAAGLTDRVKSTRAGLDAVYDPDADSSAEGEETSLHLSEGEVQMLAFTRALLERDRPFLVLDETTSRLDAAKERIIRQTIMKSPLLAHRTVVAVSHRIDFVQHFDKVIVMDQGAVKEEGNPQQLLSKGESHSQFAKLAALQNISL